MQFFFLKSKSFLFWKKKKFCFNPNIKRPLYFIVIYYPDCNAHIGFLLFWMTEQIVCWWDLSIFLQSHNFLSVCYTFKYFLCVVCLHICCFSLNLVWKLGGFLPEQQNNPYWELVKCSAAEINFLFLHSKICQLRT